MSQIKLHLLQYIRTLIPASKADISWRYDTLIARLDELKADLTRLESRLDGVERNFLFFNENRIHYSETRDSLTQDNDINKFQSFWFGGELPPLAWLSLSSFGRQGKETEVYCYERITLPQGITWMPAHDIMEQNRVFRISDSYAAFSDIFRYTLLQKKGGWWVDTDVFCIGGQFPPTEVLFAEESRGQVCGAIMKFPKDHICLKFMLWEVQKFNLQNYRWGDIGPTLLTRAVNLYANCEPMSAEKIYPVHALEAHKLILPEFYEYVLNKTKTAYFVHFWNYMFLSCFGFDAVKEAPLPGSFLDILYREHGIYERYTLGQCDENCLRATCNRFLQQGWVRKHAETNDICL
jgi:hypothetical protein